jgi:hypothetical protein
MLLNLSDAHNNVRFIFILMPSYGKEQRIMFHPLDLNMMDMIKHILIFWHNQKGLCSLYEILSFASLFPSFDSIELEALSS